MFRSLRALIQRTGEFFLRGRRERELAAELDSHLRLHIDDQLRAGAPPEDARRNALLMLGGIEATKERYRDRRGLPVLESLAADVRFGSRMLAKTPGFTAAAIAVFALGIGANTAIFSVVHAVVLRPLPFPDADRLVRVWHTPPPRLFPGQTIFSVSPANYLDWQAQNDVFDGMATYRQPQFSLTGEGEPTTVRAYAVTSGFFHVLGAAPIAGRDFGAGDEEAGAANVVILSENLWRGRFAGRGDIVGRSIQLDAEPYTVIGVMPAALDAVGPAQLWVPVRWTPQLRAERANHNFRVIARLKPGVAIARAQAAMDTISARLEQQYPEENKGWGAVVIPLHDDIVGDVRSGLLVLLGAVGVVLIIACANLANLLLSKALARSREIAIRGALGAGRGRLVQQLVVETLLLAGAGGALGLVLAYSGVGLLLAAIGDRLPRAAEIRVDAVVLAFTAAVSLLTGILAGLAPAWRLSRTGVGEVLAHHASRTGSGAAGHRTRRVLVVCEVALALMLLSAAGLLIRSLAALRSVEAGIDTANVLTAGIDLPSKRYPDGGAHARFFHDLLAQLSEIPGVESVGGIDSLPLTDDGSMQPVALDGAAPQLVSEQSEFAVRWITPGYLKTVGMPLLTGRDLTDRDAGGPAVVLVSESAARRLRPEGDVLGRKVRLPFFPDAAREVVGIVADVKIFGLGYTDAVPAVYLPLSQVPIPYMTVVLRTTVPPETLASAVVNVVRSADAELPVQQLRTMDDVVSASLGHQSFNMYLLAAFAGVALLLAGLGIYSVLAYSVRQRVREIAIRVALGAPLPGVLRLVVADGMKQTLAGVAIGLTGAIASSRVLSTLVFGVSTRDAATFAAVSVVVLAVGLGATLVPAWRAMRVDPIQALKME